MAHASVRRSFHGPLVTTEIRPSERRRPASRLAAAASGKPLELVPPAPSHSSLGRALLRAARQEQPTSSERERVLSRVLGALQRLTGTR